MSLEYFLFLFVKVGFSKALGVTDSAKQAKLVDVMSYYSPFFSTLLHRSPSGLQVPQVLSQQTLHHRLLPQTPRFPAEKVPESVVLKGPPPRDAPHPPQLKGEECASHLACSSTPEPRHLSL